MGIEAINSRATSNSTFLTNQALTGNTGNVTSPTTPSQTRSANSVLAYALGRQTDGFDQPRQTAPTNTTTAPKKKKKKKKGLFSKIGGFLKKALPIVSKIASFVPGLNAIAAPLNIASNIISSTGGGR
jgi:hypothetical protein